jgi:very-short-patch-repair endonuclease
MSCQRIGERNNFFGRKHSEESKRKAVVSRGDYSGINNPFFGKSHTEEAKIKISSHPAVRHSGEDNGFFGKTHSEETLIVIKEKNRVYQETMSVEERESISRKQRDGHRRRYEQDPESYIQGKRNGGKAAASISGKYKINQLERFFLDAATEAGIDIEYSVILDKKQYDFGNKDKRLLIEINGDFWHGNPLIYPVLSERQMATQEKDRIKKEFAESHGFRVLSFWESDIRNQIDRVMSEVKNAIEL